VKSFWCLSFEKIVFSASPPKFCCLPPKHFVYVGGVIDLITVSIEYENQVMSNNIQRSHCVNHASHGASFSGLSNLGSAIKSLELGNRQWMDLNRSSQVDHCHKKNDYRPDNGKKNGHCRNDNLEEIATLLINMAMENIQQATEMMREFNKDLSTVEEGELRRYLDEKASEREEIRSCKESPKALDRIEDTSRVGMEMIASSCFNFSA
jgi:hypothetical protein